MTPIEIAIHHDELAHWRDAVDEADDMAEREECELAWLYERFCEDHDEFLACACGGGVVESEAWVR